MSNRHSKRGEELGEVSKGFIPTGSMDKVLLTGGKNLTLLQSLGLLALGIVASVTGVSLFSTTDIWFALWGSAMSLWGLVMLFNGSKSVVRVIQRRKSQNPHPSRKGRG